MLFKLKGFSPGTSGTTEINIYSCNLSFDIQQQRTNQHYFAIMSQIMML